MRTDGSNFRRMLSQHSNVSGALKRHDVVSTVGGFFGMFKKFCLTAKTHDHVRKTC
jgi:hypothetical protein